MMWHLMKYRFKTLLKDRSLLFFSILFPIVLATFFGMTLKGAYNVDTLKPVEVAIVTNENYDQDQAFQEFIKTISQEDGLLAPRYVSEKEAESLLESGDVKGIITKTETILLKVKSSGIDQTILKTVTDEYLVKSHMIENLLANGADFQQLMATMNDTTNYLQSNSTDNVNLSVIFFYTIIAMSSLYGGNWYMRCICDTTANLSDRGIRFNVSPVKKSQALLCDFIAANVIQFVSMLILLAYLIFVIGIDFGNQISLIFLTILGGSLAGSSMGSLISAVGTQAYQVKTSLLVGITMLMSFLSGMMMVQVKYYVQAYAPIIAKINPANMITDAFYSLYYYGGGSRFYMNIASLFIFSGILYFISFIILRRKQYDSL
ncbi:ABC transporter permease [Beduini massiliensis]|uniref:ABC transporter permease n=2 Tax=Beduini massiliensis TaxID=1585974 RepID=UPI0006947754